MSLTFSPISDTSNLHRQMDYHRFLAASPQIASDYSFLNIWGWADNYGLEWAWHEELVWIRQTIPEVRFWAPVGPWHRIDWETTFGALFREPVHFIRVPDQLLAIWRQLKALPCQWRETRGHWDYVYSIPELVALKGNRFHKKKNLLNQFLKKFEFDYQAFQPGVVKQVLSMQENWCLWRDCESSDTLMAENNAIDRVLTHWEQLDGVLGGTISVAGYIVAYTVAEALSEDTVVIHFEKACPDTVGSYQAINQMFLESLGDRFGMVNREQDLDDPGLRKAKLSYHPIHLLEKSEATIG